MAPTAQPYILVVEDGLFMRQLLCGLVQCLGYTVVGVEDGLEAVAQMKREAPLLVLLDLELPKLDGEGVCRWIRRHRTLKDLPVVACTSHAEREMVVKAIRAGVNDYLCKPVDRKQLHEKLEKHLGKLGLHPVAEDETRL
jgi:CheY-like chemotaxis protein